MLITVATAPNIIYDMSVYVSYFTFVREQIGIYTDPKIDD